MSFVACCLAIGVAIPVLIGLCVRFIDKIWR